MAATYSQLGQIAGQPDFLNRVAIGMMVAANAVYTEGTGVAGHTARAAFAVKVLSGNYNLTTAAQATLTNSTIISEAQVATAGNSIPDADIQFQINSQWNAMAGA